MKQREWERADLAAAMGISVSTVNKWFAKQRSEPGLETGFKIAVALGVSAHWLLDPDSELPPPAEPPASFRESLADPTVAGMILREMGAALLKAAEANPTGPSQTRPAEKKLDRQK